MARPRKTPTRPRRGASAQGPGPIPLFAAGVFSMQKSLGGQDLGSALEEHAARAAQDKKQAQLERRRARDRERRQIKREVEAREAARRSAAAKKGAETRARRKAAVGPAQREREKSETERLKLRRDELAELFREEGSWQSYPNGRGEGRLVYQVPPGVSAKKALFDLEIRTIDAVTPFEEAWVSVGIMFEWVAARDAKGRSRDERYDRYKARWTVWTYARRSRFLGLAITQADAILDRALESGHRVTGVALRVFLGGDTQPRHWRKKGGKRA